MLNVTWSVQTLLLVSTQITDFQALVSVLQVTGNKKVNKNQPTFESRCYFVRKTTAIKTWQIRSACTEHWATRKKPAGQMVHFSQRGRPLLKPQYSSESQLPHARWEWPT